MEDGARHDAARRAAVAAEAPSMIAHVVCHRGVEKKIENVVVIKSQIVLAIGHRPRW